MEMAYKVQIHTHIFNLKCSQSKTEIAYKVQIHTHIYNLKGSQSKKKEQQKDDESSTAFQIWKDKSIDFACRSHNTHRT